MKVTIDHIQDKEKEEARICVACMTDDIRRAAVLLEHGEQILIGYREGERIPCPISRIYYIESVDEKCFAYTKEDCFEIKYKLYELETLLDSRFFRCSKSMILNIRKIRNVKSEENARLKATLLNGEVLIITRSYVREFKKKLGL